MIELPNVTFLVADCVDYGRARLAINYSTKHIKFGAVKLLTHFNITPPDPIVEKIEKIGSIERYSEFCVRDLSKYFDTEFVLVGQWDGFVRMPEMWDPDFLNYDYIGAPWKEEWLFPGVPKKFLVGNGGFSLRSKKLQDFMTENYDNMITHRAEDVTICQLNRNYLEASGFKFAPVEVAKRFSWESGDPRDSFGVHARMSLVPVKKDE